MRNLFLEKRATVLSYFELSVILPLQTLVLNLRLFSVKQTPHFPLKIKDHEERKGQAISDGSLWKQWQVPKTTATTKQLGAVIDILSFKY